MTGDRADRPNPKAPKTTTIGGTSATIGPTGPTEPAQRAGALRLARLHLRLGSLGLARAELEALAGSGELDEAALLDLAEIRWRTGDLPGAGEAAVAAISTGDESALALVIAAEAAAGASRPAEARRLAGQALARAEQPLDRIFAGMPRSSIWPHDADGRGMGEIGIDEPPAAHAARVRASVAPRGLPVAHIEPLERTLGRAFEASPTLAAAWSEIAAGRVATAATRLALVLRFAPSRAAEVVAVTGERTESPLALVRADALVALGREDEAQAAYRAAVDGLGPVADATPSTDRSTG